MLWRRSPPDCGSEYEQCLPLFVPATIAPWMTSGLSHDLPSQLLPAGTSEDPLRILDPADFDPFLEGRTTTHGELMDSSSSDHEWSWERAITKTEDKAQAQVVPLSFQIPFPASKFHLAQQP